jgi:hypothetical protein
MPERHQEQQSQKKKQGLDRRVTSTQRLVVHHLAGKTPVVFCRRSVLMEQPDTVKANKTQKRDLDNPSAHALFPIGPMFGHTLTKLVNRSYRFVRNP